MSSRALLVAALLLGAAPAAAHDPSPPEFGEEIVVEGHYRDRVGTSDAASAGSFTRQLVEDRPLLRPGEVLELVPGLIITQHSGAGKANQYYLRGFDLDHGTDFQTNLDGVPLNLRTHAHGQGYTDLNFVIPELVARGDYWKGPYDAARGDFASAGGADLRYADALPSSVLDLTGGTYGYGRGLVAGTMHLLGGHLLYAGELMHEDGPWVRPDAYVRWNGVLRWARALGDGKLTLEAMGYAGRWNATDQVPRQAVADGLVGRFGGLDPTTGGDSHRYSLSASLEHDLGPGRLQATAYGVKYDLDLFSNFTYFLDYPAFPSDQLEQRDDRWYYGASGSWRVDGELAGLRAEARVGGEARQDRLRPVGLYRTEARRRLATTRQDEVDETSGGVYAEAGLRPLPWLHAVAGVRWDEFGFRVRSGDPRNSGDVTAGRASPKAELVLGPWAATELFLDAGFGFHSNDARGVTTHVDPATQQAVQPVTPLVRTRGAEGGVRSELLPGVQSSLALWVLALDSELVFTGDAGTTEPTRPSRREGVEWSARWQPVRWLLLDLDVALSRARFTAPDPRDPRAGDDVPGAIASAVAAGASLRPLGAFSASVFLRYFGPRPLVVDGSQRSAGAALVNAQLGWRVATPLLLTLDVFNVLDAQVDDASYSYASRVAPGAAAREDVHFHPAEPRTLRLTAAISF